MKRLTIAVALAAAVGALAGCEQKTPEQAAADKARYPATFVEVIHDDTRNVTCWEYGGTNGGISCLPDWMLTPPRIPVSAATNADGTPCTNKVCAAFAQRRDAQACAMGELTGPACDAWRERSRQAREALGLGVKP